VTVQIRDSDGTVRLSGDLLASGGATGDVLTQQADGTYEPAASSAYTPPTARQGIGSSSSVSIGNGGSDLLAWDGTSFGPDTLLDRTTTTVPSVLTAGIYAVTVLVAPGEDMTVGGNYQTQLELDSDSTDATATQDSAPANANALRPDVTLAMVWYIPANGTLRLRVRNHDGAAARGFGFGNIQIQKIT
jgi:hypothetical protein